MLLEVAGADPEIVALGLEPTVEERIADKLLERYRGNDVCSAFFNTIGLVVDRELLDLAGSGPSPALHLALVGSQLKLEPSGRGLLSTEWEMLIVLPVGPTFEGMAGLTRLRLVWLLFGLTLGENVGSLENDDAPGWPLTMRLSEFGEVAAPRLEGDNATLRTVIGFTFESNVTARTGEV